MAKYSNVKASCIDSRRIILTSVCCIFMFVYRNGMYECNEV